jgi:hypothetical protein
MSSSAGSCRLGEQFYRLCTLRLVPMKTLAASLVLALYGASLLPTPAVAGGTDTDCRLVNLHITIGMSRTEVEHVVAAALGVPSKYNVYGNNLEGGTIAYVSNHCTLKVDFSPGAPAPRIALPSGQTEHLQPMDERVLAIKLLLVPPGAAPTPDS